MNDIKLDVDNSIIARSLIWEMLNIYLYAKAYIHSENYANPVA